MRRPPRLIARAFAFVLASACRRDPPAPQNVAARVVSLSPSTTEAVFAIGAGSELVGRSRYCDYPPEALALPQVGGYADPSVEAILGLRPDLAVGARGPAGAKIERVLTAHGVRTFFAETESLAQIDEMLRGLGARTGHVAEAERVVSDLDAREEAITRAVASAPKVRVLLLFGVSPIVVAGPGGFPDELLRRAGGTNVVAEGTAYPSASTSSGLHPRRWTRTSFSIRRSATRPERVDREAPGWAEVNAVKRGRVVPLPDEAVLRPGPRIADGLAAIARALHPDVALP